MTLLESSKVLDEILPGMDLLKCQQCGCMTETLEQIERTLPQLPPDEAALFQSRLPGWLAQMKPVRYSCLGCDPCYAGSVQNAFTGTFPQTADSFGLSCEIQSNAEAWPPVVGDYLIADPSAPVAVVTLACLDLPQKIIDRLPAGLAIAGKLETENIGIDKLVKNVTANPHLRYLVIAGIDSVGHHSGQTLLALVENGVDPAGRVIGALGKRPVLKNVSPAEVEAFRRQIQVVDLIGCEDPERISDLIQELAGQTAEQTVDVVPCGCSGGT